MSHCLQSYLTDNMCDGRSSPFLWTHHNIISKCRFPACVCVCCVICVFASMQTAALYYCNTHLSVTLKVREYQQVHVKCDGYSGGDHIYRNSSDAALWLVMYGPPTCFPSQTGRRTVAPASYKHISHCD